MRLFGFVQPSFKRLCEAIARGLRSRSAHCLEIFPDKLSPVMYIFHVLARVIQRYSTNIQSPAFARLWNISKSKVSNSGLIHELKRHAVIVITPLPPIRFTAILAEVESLTKQSTQWITKPIAHPIKEVVNCIMYFLHEVSIQQTPSTRQLPFSQYRNDQLSQICAGLTHSKSRSTRMMLRENGTPCRVLRDG